jgi:hypothetical protein
MIIGESIGKYIQCRFKMISGKESVAPQALSEGSGLLILKSRQSRRNKITKAGAFVKLRRRVRLAPQALDFVAPQALDFVAPQALSEGSGLRNAIS